jgi:TolB-like protein/DNA-binding winged helix-turn-helix (wHTH) protein
LDRLTAVPLRIGAWRVDPAIGQIARGEETVRVEARTMRLLLCLAQRPGEVVSIDDLLKEVWSGVVVTPDSVYQAVASLRRLLGDDPKQPTYIANVPRLGYRMVASVGLWADSASLAPETPPIPATRRRRAILFAAGTLCLALALTLLFRGRTSDLPSAISATPIAPAKSIAVLPFLDLTTQDMDKEYFADGMTEELIDRLSKIPDLRVPSATSSFYFKDKKLKVADIAKSLGVLYVLDGSIRKSNDTLRVAARLIRADDGYVIWSETYDRPLENELKVQDEIAGEVAKALKGSFN